MNQLEQYRISRLACILQEYQSKELPNSRIQPDRRWFGNTRVVGQKQLEQFREEMTAKVRFLSWVSCLDRAYGDPRLSILDAAD